jgi:hypothetical protein
MAPRPRTSLAAADRPARCIGFRKVAATSTFAPTARWASRSAPDFVAARCSGVAVSCVTSHVVALSVLAAPADHHRLTAIITKIR